MMRWGPGECAPLDMILEIQKLKSCGAGTMGRENIHLGKRLRLGCGGTFQFVWEGTQPQNRTMPHFYYKIKIA